MNILVLGGTGYLGTKLISKISKNNKIFVLYIGNKNKLNNIFFNKNITLISYEKFKKRDYYIKDIDVAYSLIGVYKKIDTSDQQIINGNFTVPLEFFLRCIKYNVSKFISIDTGLPDDFNIYSYSKSLFREIAKWYLKSSKCKMQFINVQPEIFYGFDEPKDRFIPNTIIKLKKNEDINMTLGTQKRDYLYVEDLINVLIILLRINKPKYINLPTGTGDAPSVKEVVLYLKKITKSNSKINFGAIKTRDKEPDCRANLSMLNKLNIKIQTPWKKGMKILVSKIC